MSFSIPVQRANKKPVANRYMAAGRWSLVVSFGLFSLSNHNRQHAAIGPMVVGMVVTVIVMDYAETHDYFKLVPLIRLSCAGVNELGKIVSLAHDMSGEINT
jgi:hypothetical protein